MYEKVNKIEDLGYDLFFESNRVKLGLDKFQVARVIAEHRGLYKVKNISGEYLAKITGKQLFKSLSKEDYPAVGDWVIILEIGEGNATIKDILPRKTILKRKYSGKDETQVIAVNVDVVFIIESVDRDYNLNRLERYLAIASDGGAKSVIILNKTDLITKEELDIKKAQIKNRFQDVDIISTSTLTDEGLDELKMYLKNQTYCFLGSSGVGKSSLIKKMIGNSEIKIGEIGSHSGRGKHTTTSREMYFLESGAIVIDNPGIREVGMTDMAIGINNEILLLAKKCKFIDCTHISEPGCGVLPALEAGVLDKDKYANYLRLRKEAEYYEMNKIQKKEKSRQFGNFIKKAKKDLKKYKNKGYEE
jgi:ribosome biogenesis GTPase